MLSQYTFSTESISHQKETLLRDSLITAIVDLRKKGDFTTKAMKSLKDTIRIRTGLNIVFKLEGSYEAYMQMPNFDKNNPIHNHYIKQYTNNKDAVELLKSKNKIKGTVDLNKSIVTGMYSELPITVGIGIKLLSQSFLTPTELVAIILHEVGHAFTYFELLGTALTTNHALVTAMSDQSFGKDRKRTVEIVTAVEGHLGIRLKHKEKMADGNTDLFTADVMREVILSQQAELGTSVFDERGCELMADIFAARHGSAMDLVTALDKLGRMFKSSEYRNGPTFVLVEMIKVLGTITAMTAVPATVSIPYIAAILATNPMSGSYDDAVPRAKRLRDQVVSALKDKSITRERRSELLEQIEAIDKTMVVVAERETFYQFLWNNILPWGKRQANSIKFQKSMETLMNNDMFVAANRLQNLNKDT